jgi:putative inorganic carbon (HCO3(-)) transporter
MVASGSRLRDIATIGLLGAAMAVLALMVTAGPSEARPLAIGIAVVLLLALVVADLRRVLLAVVVLEFPLQLDVFLNYDEPSSLLGAYAGLNISVSTFAIVALWLLRAADPPPPLSAAARRQVRRIGLPLTLYVVATLLTIAVAEDQALSLFELALLIQTLLLFAYIVTSLRTRDDVMLVVAMLLVGAAVQGLLALCLLAGIDPLAYGGERWILGGLQEDGGVTRFAGTMTSPNSAAAFISLTLAPALALVVARVSGRVRLLALASIALGGLALALTLSRGGAIGACVSIVVFVAIAVYRRLAPPRVLTSLVLATLVMVAVIAVAVFPRVTTDDEGAAASRVPLVAQATHMAEDNVITGVGANNFSTALGDYRTREFGDSWKSVVHNKYLLVLSENGIVTLIIFAWFLVATVLLGMRAAQRRHGLTGLLALGLAAAVAGQMAHMLFDHFHNRTAVQGLWIVAALIAVIAVIHVHEAERLEGTSGA